MDNLAIKTIGLTKSYGKFTAVDNLNLEVKHGELFSLLGVNGAGKTTTIKMLSCLASPSAGTATLSGFDIIHDTLKVKELINVSPQETAVAQNLSVRENLEFICGIYGHKRAEQKGKADEFIEKFSLGEYAKRSAKNLSGGLSRRLSIAMALITEPEILFLDEPTLGLDVIARHDLWKIIEALKGKITVILTTHYLEEAQSLSDRIGIMAKGKLVACDTPENLIKSTGKQTFEDAFISLCTGGIAE